MQNPLFTHRNLTDEAIVLAMSIFPLHRKQNKESKKKDSKQLIAAIKEIGVVDARRA